MKEAGMKPKFVLAGLAAALAWVAYDAGAQTLYKLIDKDGKVTYSEKPPKDFDGKVVPMNIDPNANTATLPKYSAPPSPESSGGKEPPRRSKESASASPKSESVDDIRARLEAAKQAYQNAVDNPGDGDVTRVGNVNGMTRPVFSEAYQARLNSLEGAVKKAEEDLRRAQGG
jgi:predicted lipid-binding transport protein (Tim44 family)